MLSDAIKDNGLIFKDTDGKFMIGGNKYYKNKYLKYKNKYLHQKHK
jgi:hypothetical protein